MMRRRHTNKRLLAAILLLLVWVGCADHCGQLAYDRVIHERTGAFPHSTPPAELWTTTRSVLAEKGVKFEGVAPPIKDAVQSPWKGKPGDRRQWSVRILVAPEGAFLEVNRTEEREVDTFPDVTEADVARKPNGTRIETKTQRDWDTEWTVLKQLAPTAATEIEAAAQKRSDEVRDVVGNGCQ